MINIPPIRQNSISHNRPIRRSDKTTATEQSSTSHPVRRRLERRQRADRRQKQLPVRFDRRLSGRRRRQDQHYISSDQAADKTEPRVGKHVNTTA